MKLNTIKTLRPLLASLLLISVISYYLLLKYTMFTNSEPYFVDWTRNDTISCYYVTEGDALQPAGDLSPPEDSIFFHETSCRGGLNSREACAVESAARKHPARSVYVFFNSPVSEAVLTRSCLAKLTQFENVRLARLHIKEYAQGTALSQMIADKEHNKSNWRIELTSDLLRFISMYKYGGLYLDTDILVVKPLDSLGKDWAARQNEKLVNVAVLAISKNGIGHKLVSEILEQIKFHYRPRSWGYHGPGVMTRTLVNFCNTKKVVELNADVCQGFQVYEPQLFYPIYWYNGNNYFESELSVVSDQKIIDVFTHHLWNKLTHNMTVEPGSLFDRLAWQHCPTIRTMYGEQFGT